jgi:hypothetical protein
MPNSAERLGPECRVSMIAGRQRGKGDSFATSQEAWLPGEPVPELLSWFSGKGEALPVTTYACPRCGLLRSYVAPESLR